MKRLYISDLDGTLLDPKPEITARTAEVINALTARGMYFTFATARSIYSALPITSALDINVPCILMNGVSIYDIKNNSYIKSEFIDPEVSAELLRIYKRHGVECFMYRIEEGALICYYSELTSRVMRSFAEVRKHEYKKPFVQCRLEDYADGYTVYFTTRGRYEELLPVKLEAEKIAGIDHAFYLDVYDDSWYLELFSHKASKSNGLRFLREKYGFDEVAAFGDNLNDLPLFAEADIKIAVGNARDEVKAAADYVIGTNSDDGVARWLLDEIKVEN
ncbi:MAG: HAD family phosphatase [Ruminococcus sp.]|uniref:HAD family hydrolase n=1 Tax=Ruminococcus sp. TaxID=41978 RepID=UPI001B2F3E4C|nr:HAD family hydrolase [Ruminococcus sp.]MBO7473773.1 HAD family phosphatase [Ruminococcus sp.]